MTKDSQIKSLQEELVNQEELVARWGRGNFAETKNFRIIPSTYASLLKAPEGEEASGPE